MEFDLLGDPVPEGFGRRGRPAHLVTDRNRNKIMLLLAVGWGNERISKALGITLPTLRKHYFRQLKVRDEARDRLDGEALARFWDLFGEGNVAAGKELMKLVEKHDLQGTRFGTAVPAAEPKLGKKEKALADAMEPSPDTPSGRAAARRAAQLKLH